MGIFETFSKRKKLAENQGKSDVYQYDDLPKPFRIQVLHIWRRSIGPYDNNASYSYSGEPRSHEVWKELHDIIASELGVFRLGSVPADERYNSYVGCASLLMEGNTDHVLDIIELSFRAIDKFVRDFTDHDFEGSKITQGPDSAIEELNHRFREHAIGYQYSDGQLIRVDSQYAHAEVIMPAIGLLKTPGFEGSCEEFLKAHQHYRHDRFKEAINDALKAFESTMKAICSKRKWKYPDNATAKVLIQTLMDNQLIPTNMQSEFTALRSLLESGLPTVRNKSTSSHGQGVAPVEVPSHVAAFALHLAAANIIFLIESLPK